MFPSSSSLQIKEYSVIIFFLSCITQTETFVTNMITITYQLYQCHAEVFPILLFVVQNPFIWSLLLALIFIVLGKSPSSAPLLLHRLPFPLHIICKYVQEQSPSTDRCRVQLASSLHCKSYLLQLFCIFWPHNVQVVHVRSSFLAHVYLVSFEAVVRNSNKDF